MHDDVVILTRPEDELDARQLRALDLLLTGASDNRVARELDVDPRTVRAWTQRPAFARLYAHRMRELGARARIRAIAELDRCIDHLVALRNGEVEGQRAADGLAATRVLIDLAYGRRDVGDEPEAPESTMTDEELQAAIRRLLPAPKGK